MARFNAWLWKALEGRVVAPYMYRADQLSILPLPVAHEVLHALSATVSSFLSKPIYVNGVPTQTECTILVSNLDAYTIEEVDIHAISSKYKQQALHCT